MTGGELAWVAPGSRLPAWAVHVLASWPDLHPAWWDDEAFLLAAEGLGLSPHQGDRGAKMAEDPDAAAKPAWEAVAKRILAMDIMIEKPDPSTVRGWQYGLRHLTTPASRQAQQKLEAHGFKPIDGYL